MVDRQRYEFTAARRRFAFALVALIAVLLDPAAVLSAVAYRITTEPHQPIVGQPAVITIATTVYGSGGGGASPEPLPMDEFPWEFVADAPSGGRYSVALAPVGSAGNEFSAHFEFGEPGEWEIGLHPRHLSTPLDPTLGARTTVVVVDRVTPPPSDEGVPSPTTSRPWPLVLLAALVLGALVLARRSRDIRQR